MFLLPGFQKIDFYCVSMNGHRQKNKYFTDLWFLSRKDLLKLIKSVDIVFLPSRVEGFSYTIAESLSLWTWVLARKDWGWFKKYYGNLLWEFGSYDHPEILLNWIFNSARINKKKHLRILWSMDIVNTSKSYSQLYSNLLSLDFVARNNSEL
jgi:hypothetical protein